MFGQYFGQAPTFENIQMIDPALALEWRSRDKALIVDVREENEYLSGHIPGAVLLPLSKFDPAKVPTAPEGKHLLIHCRSGSRCGMAAMLLAASGRKDPIYRLSGGILAWAQAGGEIVAGR